MDLLTETDGGAVHLFVLENFNGELFEQIEGYRDDMLAAAADLQRRAAHTVEFGGLLTGDVIAQGTSIIRSINVRNQNPVFPPLFLTFLENRPWIAPIDAALARMKRALLSTRPPTPRVYAGFLTGVAASPMGGLFELNVYDVLDRAFPGAVPQPTLTGSTKRSDVRIEINGVVIYVEATVLNEGQHWRGIDKYMREHGLSVHSSSGPGPAADARRIVLKSAEELKQTAPDASNLLAISFFGAFPSELARDWAFADLLAGAPRYGRSTDPARPEPVDLTNLERIDSIFEFDRARLRRVHVNPRCGPAFRLDDETRRALRAALESTSLMIR